MADPLERFVNNEAVANFLDIPKKDVQKLTREEKITGYPYCGKVRKRYRYRLSEVARDFARLRKPSKIAPSSPSDSEPENKNG